MTSSRPVQQVMKAYPSMADLSDLAFKHDKKGLMDGLARRYDALQGVKYMEAVSSFNFLTENKNKTVKEAEWAGISGGGERPETNETVVKILWEICNGDN